MMLMMMTTIVMVLKTPTICPNTILTKENKVEERGEADNDEEETNDNNKQQVASDESVNKESA